MTQHVLPIKPAISRYKVLFLLWLLAAGLVPGLARAQSPGPDGGTLSPATSTVCAGFNSGNITLTGYTGTILKFQANSGSGYVDIANSASPTYTFANLSLTTSFRAVVQNGTNAPVTSTVATVTVNQPPTATINSQGATTFCQRGTIYLVAGPGGAGYTYQFLMNGRDIIGATSQTYTATVTASADYSVRVSDAAGCSSISSTVSVRVNSNNAVSLSASGPTTVCQGSSVLLTASTTGPGAGGYTYQYQLNGNQIPGATSPTYAATATGSYTVTVYNPSTCTALSNAIAVTVTPAPVVSFSYPTTTYCVSGSNPTPTVSPTGGSFSSTTGLSLNPTSGTINLSQSQPGTYAVTYTSSGTCPTSANYNVTITAAPAAGFSYATGSRCAGTAGTLTPSLASGATAGTFSSTSGLSLNASTGAIDLAQSQPGTYTVTNTVAGTTGCATVAATTQVTLLAQPTAALTASGATTFCQGGSLILTASGGAAGATYQFLNNGQAIGGATSATYNATASGSYSVIITNPGGCASTSAPVAVTVPPATTATFSYPASAFCLNAANPTASITGTAGGTFSSTSGLSLNASTGAINLSSSTPGTYTVTYGVGGPCPSSSTASVVLTSPAVATFGYAATSYCVGGSNPTATLSSGASAGTFTAAPAGLRLNSGTGAIDLSQSLPGTYTITNTVAANGGCPAAIASTSVSIVAVPAAGLAASGPTTFCQGSSVTLTANGGGPNSTYQFLNNGQPIGGATGATYTATASGSYSVLITNAGLCSATSPGTAVTVNPIATPTLSYPATSLCQNGGPATPTVTVAGGSFSSTTGLSLNASTGVITPAQSQPGTYIVTYTGGSPCPGSTTATVTITAAPSAAFAYAGGATYCPTSTTNPVPTITGTTGGTFSAPAGLVIDPATGAINLQTSTAGTYAVTYSVPGTCTASSTVSVTITTAPVATFAYPAAGGYCAGSAGTAAPSFSVGGSAGTFSSTTGLSLNASTGVVNLSQSQPGTYTVTNTIAASGACSAVTASASIVVNAAPAATLTAGGPTTFCAGGSVLLTAPAGSGFTYQFLNNGLPIGGATGATYTATGAGSYSVTITNASGCASTSSAMTIVVNPATTATFSYPAASFCGNSALATTPTITGTAGGTFSAPAGLGLNPTTGTIVPSTSTPGTYTVTYGVGGPCPSSSTASVTITAPASAAFSYAGTSFCASGTAAASLAAGSTAGTFSAAPAGLSLNASTGAINLSSSTPGTYTVTNTVAASGGCAATVAAANITVNPLPAQPTLTANGAVLTASGAAGSAYQFYLNGTAIAGATGATYTATQNGSYTVVATAANGCASLPSAAVSVTVTAMHASQAAFGLTAYPNPTLDGHLTVTIVGTHPTATLELLNALGQRVLTATLPAAASTHELDLSGLATGVYTLRATTEAGTVMHRIVRQ